GEPGTTAVLEMSLLGPELAVRETCVIGLAGADLGGEVVEEGRRLRPGSVTVVEAGTTLRFPEAHDGCRAYLGLAGGIDVPLMLGSRSTCLVGRFGGIDGEGRPVRAGDLLRPTEPGGATATASPDRVWPGPAGGAIGSDAVATVRVVAGPHLDRFPGGVLDRLASAKWTASVRSDRMGVRLEGDALPGAGGELVSLPMVWGAIQVTAGGQPIVLLADHQTVGGYPVPAVVASVDRPVIGQLRAGDRIRFEPVTFIEALALRGVAEAAFEAVRASVERRR
ncbi:MAG: biotin-dependent carboxyltransferase family protein, partial [Candidatus Limnocylindrales bacterium]